MPETLWLNGQFIDSRDEARVSAFDAGFQHAVGLFETITAASGRVIHLQEHLARLERSARELRLTESLSPGPLGQAIELAYQKSELDRARIRLTLTGGDLNMLARARETNTDNADASDQSGGDTPTILIHCAPATPYPDEMFEQGVTVTIADTKANPLNHFEGHKTLSYWWRLRELQTAASRGAGESIVLQVTNHLAGGCVSNLFLVKDGALLTPIARGEEEETAVPSPVLPGVTRGFVLGHAEEAGIPVHRRLLTVDDLLDADEAFLTNASWGVLPITRVESREIGDGAVGETTTRFRDAWVGLLGG